jgi:hypothetical protein
MYMAVNKPTGDNARKGAVRKRSQVKTTLAGASAWTKRSKASGKFVAVKKPARAKSAAKKFKGVRAEKKAARR